MGAPSDCRVSTPVTCAAGESGALRSVVPCADQPPEEGEISNSSWPTVWPSSWMVNLPLSGAKTGAFFCACEARALSARMHTARTPEVILDSRDLRIIGTTPSCGCEVQSLPQRRREAWISRAHALRVLLVSSSLEMLQTRQDFQGLGSSTTT